MDEERRLNKINELLKNPKLLTEELFTQEELDECILSKQRGMLTNALCVAVELDDVESVRLLLKKGFDPKISDNYPLIIAARKCDIEILRLLIEQPGVDINHNNGYLLWTAAYYGKIEIVNELLKYPQTDIFPAFIHLLEYTHSFKYSYEYLIYKRYKNWRIILEIFINDKRFKLFETNMVHFLFCYNILDDVDLNKITTECLDIINSDDNFIKDLSKEHPLLLLKEMKRSERKDHVTSEIVNIFVLEYVKQKILDSIQPKYTFDKDSKE